jgi:hypothetical protein
MARKHHERWASVANLHVTKICGLGQRSQPRLAAKRDCGMVITIARPPGATEKENPNDFLQGRPAMTMQNEPEKGIMFSTAVGQILLLGAAIVALNIAWHYVF